MLFHGANGVVVDLLEVTLLNCCGCVGFGLKLVGLEAVAFCRFGGGILVLGRIEAKLIRGVKLIFPFGLHINDNTFPDLANSMSSTVMKRTEVEETSVAG